MGEVQLAALLCSFLSGGEVERPKDFVAAGDERGIRVDCETKSHVIEVGLDGKNDSRDSVHQAIFASHLTEKIPAVIFIDRDGKEGRYEYEARIVTERLGVRFATCSAGFLQRWAATAGLRAISTESGVHDLPLEAELRTRCDLTPIFGQTFSQRSDDS